MQPRGVESKAFGIVHPIAGSILLCPLLAFLIPSEYLNHVAALGSQCSVPLGEGSAGQDEPYWLEKMKHQGLSAYNNDPTNYRTFRNVKEFGAKGDGVTDDTQAILSVYVFPHLRHAATDGFHC